MQYHAMLEGIKELKSYLVKTFNFVVCCCLSPIYVMCKLMEL